MTRGKTKAQLGRSMVEILGVLSIVGMLSVGGVMYYSYALAKNKMNKAINNAMLIAVNTMSYFKLKDLEENVDPEDRNTYEWDITEAGKDMGFIDDSMNPWKASDGVKVVLNKENHIALVPTVEVYYSDVPEWVCQRLGFQDSVDILYVSVVDSAGEEIVNSMDNKPTEFIAACKALSTKPTP